MTDPTRSQAEARASRPSTPSDASRDEKGAVIFDLDGVLVDSEQVWDQSRRDVVAEHGGTWKNSATTDMLGMSSKEWPVYLIEELGVPLSVEQINAAVVDAMLREYRAHLPLLPGAREAVERLGKTHTLGLASSSNRPVIDLVLETMGVADRFKATVSSEEVARGKPAPDVYQEALRRLGVETATAIEDSDAGLRAAHAAGLKVIAIPNPHFPPSAGALEFADVRLDHLDQVTADVV
jgi:HAD superfamily hydrolase (TIGR01509 family)